MTDLERIEARMGNGEPFRFMDLHSGFVSADYRLADRTIQKWRKAGRIENFRGPSGLSWWRLVAP